MDVLASIAAILVFTMACNLDTILLSMGYAARGLAVFRRGFLVLEGVAPAAVARVVSLSLFPRGLHIFR